VWSGAVELGVPCGLRVLVNAQAVEALLAAPAVGLACVAAAPGRTAPLAAVRDALAPSRLALRAQLQDCVIELGALQDLQVGDVVRVRHALHDPLQLCDAEGRMVCTGFLARRGGAKALELVSSLSAAEPTAKVLP
jgi:hypothetical protein